MTESLEAFDAMIVAHTRRAHATKGHVFLHDVENHIVDADAARSGAVQESFLFTLVGAEVVGSKWPRVCIDEVDGLIELLTNLELARATVMLRLERPSQE